MNKRLSVWGSAVAILALLITVMGVKAPFTEIKYDVSYVAVDQCYDDADDMNTTMLNEPTVENTAPATSSGALGALGGVLGSFGGSSDGFGAGFADGIGGIGGIIGDSGDLLGGFLGGGLGSATTGVVNTTIGGNDYVYIDPVPAATQPITQGTTIVPAAPQTVVQSTFPVAETIDPAALSNPYAKPAGEIRPGDMGDGVKWIQWNIIYSGYGLAGKEISGIYDDETVEVVKKLQAEKGLAADGVVNDAVIDKIELLYFEYITSKTQSTVPGTTVPATNPASVPGTADDNGDGNILFIILAVFLIIVIWIIAIIIILIILIVKKKKAKKKAASKPENEAQPQEASEMPESEKQSNDMSLSDLFDEANNKKK